MAEGILSGILAKFVVVISLLGDQIAHSGSVHVSTVGMQRVCSTG